MGGRFIITKTSEENPEHNERSSTPILEDNVLDTTLEQDWAEADLNPVCGRGTKRLVRNRDGSTTPGERNQPEIYATPTTETDPNIITVVD